MRKVVVSGATSFIGLSLIKRLLHLGYQVHAITRPHAAKRSLLPTHESLSVAEYDFADYKYLHESLNFVPDIYFSLPWSGTRGADREDENLQYSNYVNSMDGLYSMLHTGCKLVTTAGSQAEYGLYDKKIDEYCEEKPVTQYGKYKLKFFQESLAACNLRQVQLIEPRFFSVYGPYDYAHSMVQNTIMRLLSNQPCYFTEATQMWDYLYIDDAVDAIICLAETPCANGVYNLGSGIAKPLKDYIFKMKELTNSNSDLIFGAIPYPESGRVSIEPDISKLVLATGWKAKTSFKDGILNVVKSFNV